MTKTKENARKKGLITINSFSDETGLDRRTIGKYVGESGLQPVERHRGAAFYDKAELLEALADVLAHKKKARASTPQAIQCKNLLRIVSEETVCCVAADCLGIIASFVRGALIEKGISEADANGAAIMTWIVGNNSLWAFISRDRFSQLIKDKAGKDIDELWAHIGYVDKSAPRKTLSMPVPEEVQQWAKSRNFKLKDPFPVSHDDEDAFEPFGDPLPVFNAVTQSAEPSEPIEKPN